MTSRPGVPSSTSGLIVPVIVQPVRPTLGPQSGDAGEPGAVGHAATGDSQRRLSLPLRVVSNAIREPPGEHDGWPPCWLPVVSRTRPVPFASARKRLVGPAAKPAPRWKTRRPSGRGKAVSAWASRLLLRP